MLIGLSCGRKLYNKVKLQLIKKAKSFMRYLLLRYLERK